MKKGYLLFLIFVLIIPATFANIAIITDQHIYNLGNKIKASASILQSSNFEGLFKLTISCGNYKLQYFLTPISLESNFRTAVNVPDLAVTPSMMGKCTLMGDLLTNDNVIIEEKESNIFEITSQLNILSVTNKITSLPGDVIRIIGIVSEAFGNSILKASTKITLDNNSYIIETPNGKFNLTLELQKNIKSGKHTIEIDVSDSKSNSGSSSIELEITAVPNYIKTDLSSNEFAPGSKIDIVTSLYDQADDLINTSLELELTSPSRDNIFRKVVLSNEKIYYEISQYSEPGVYELISKYKNLMTKSLINITTIREIKVKYENETVLIENVGNIPFEDELTFILESGFKKYPITKNIEVLPGKMLSIDLSKEVPLGIYKIIIAVKEGIKPVTKNINGTFQSVVESAQTSLSEIIQGNKIMLADDVTIHDHRPLYKRIASSASSISGLLVGADGLLVKNPLVAPAILASIILLLVLRYGRKPIMRFFKRDKDDKNKEN